MMYQFSFVIKKIFHTAFKQMLKAIPFLSVLLLSIILIPMVTGVSYDLHVMALSFASESSQWWRSIAIVVIFGLLVATLLTLVVVPVLYALIEELKKALLKVKATLVSYECTLRYFKV